MSAFEDDENDDDDDGSEELYCAKRKEKKEKKARLLTLTLKNVPLLRVEQRFQVFRGRFRHDVCIMQILFFVLLFCYFCVVVLFFEFEGSKEIVLSKCLSLTQIWLCKCFFLTRQSVLLTLVRLNGG